MPNLQEAQIIKNVSHAVFHTVYKVSPDSTIHKNEQIYEGVWGMSVPPHPLATAVGQTVLQLL